MKHQKSSLEPPSEQSISHLCRKTFCKSVANTADPYENSDNEEEYYAGVPVCCCLHLCLSVSKPFVMSKSRNNEA